MPSPRSEGRERVRAEGPIPLDQACRYVPSNSALGHATPSTLVRWIVRGKGGVRLDAVRIDGVWHTSIEAIGRVRRAGG